MKYVFLVLALLFFIPCSYSQKNTIVPDLEPLLTEANFKAVDAVVKKRIAAFSQAKTPDTLGAYVGYIGKAATALRGEAAAKNELLAFIQKIRKEFPYHKANVKVSLEAAAYLGNQGNNELAYEIVKNLQQYFAQKESLINSDLPAMQTNLGNYSMRSGKYGVASEHYRRSITYLKRDPNPDLQKLYFANNSLGIVNWYATKLDSAMFFWNNAISILQKMDSTPLNRQFRIALVQNNMAGCYNVMGKTKQAISMFENVINNYKLFIASPTPDPKKEDAAINQFQAVDNLAKVYLELGDFTRAHDLLNYSYQQKLSRFGEKSPEVYKSLIFLGTIYNNQRSYAKAETFLNKALEQIKSRGDINNSWAAESYWQLAVAYQGMKRNTQAAAAFKQADEIYEAVYQGQYDDLFLNYLSGMSLFYAKNGDASLALSSVNKGLHYVSKSQGETSLATVMQLKNLAEVNFILKKYKETLSATARALKIVNSITSQTHELLDSIKTGTEKPALILLQVKAQHALLQKKDTQAIASMLATLYEAKNIIDKRKTILAGENDINALLANNKELQDFIKKLNHELYRLTGKTVYLDKLVNAHESGIYTRIRSRMDKQAAIFFSHVPAAISEQEIKLKESMQVALQGNAPHDQKIRAYLDAISKWNDYQDMLKKNYPDYYNMRYASKEQPLAQLSRAIPAGVTVLRYMLTGDELLVLISTNKKQQLITLDGTNLAQQLEMINDSRTAPAKTGELCYSLYRRLWQPLEKEIAGTRVMIIPDDLLYNLSFEMLTPVPVNDFASLASKCLLNKYSISYHYSLLALAPKKGPASRKENFIGFSPEFSDNQKRSYSSLLKNDSLHADNTYLSLLPLPFTTDLVKDVHAKLGGDLFLNDQSTPVAFREKAGNHSIIYIGTHAETNNSFPGLSRLIFAKDPQRSGAENSMYLYDIYNCDLRSDLSVLTACESGKPGYQDGEGMISMAHAFNYAGSESILAGLWKIDEQSSSIITAFFIKQLEKGLTKDEALRMAKLEYFKQHGGRLLAPRYWAGLVIMGDTSPIVLKTRPSNSLYWLGGIGAALLIALIAWMASKKKRLSPSNI